MKAAVLHALDGLPAYEDFADPTPPPDGELATLVAAGIHPFVRSVASGRHYGSTGHYPLIPGADAVVRTADGTLAYTGGLPPPYGTLAERIAVPAMLRVALPAGADPVAIAGAMNPGLASWMPLLARSAEVDALGTVLVLGVTGMAGLLAVENAFVLGATRVVGAGRDPDGLARAAKAGAVTVPLTGDRTADAAALVAALAGTSPSIVVDFVWGAPAETAFAALGRRGLDEDRADIAYVQIGSMAGADAAVPSTLLRSRRIRISGSGAGSASIAAIIAQLPRYMQLIVDGRITVPTRVFTLAQIADAWTTAAQSGRRVVVVP